MAVVGVEVTPTGVETLLRLSGLPDRQNNGVLWLISYQNSHWRTLDGRRQLLKKERWLVVHGSGGHFIR